MFRRALKRLFRWLQDADKRDKQIGFLMEKNLEHLRFIGILRSEIATLEDRIWSLEDHSPKETVERMERKVADWASAVEELEMNHRGQK